MERPSFNPYGAPVPTTDQEWVRSLISGDYRPLFGFAAAVTVSLGLKVLVEAAAAIISVASIGMVNRALAGQLAPLATVEAIVAGGRVVARVDLIATVGAIVAFCAFVVRAHGNAVSFGRMPLEFTAAGAVAYFFVPLAGLFQPFRAMAEIWRASEPRPG